MFASHMKKSMYVRSVCDHDFVVCVLLAMCRCLMYGWLCNLQQFALERPVSFRFDLLAR